MSEQLSTVLEEEKLPLDPEGSQESEADLNQESVQPEEEEDPSKRYNEASAEEKLGAEQKFDITYGTEEGTLKDKLIHLHLRSNAAKDIDTSIMLNHGKELLASSKFDAMGAFLSGSEMGPIVSEAFNKIQRIIELSEKALVDSEAMHEHHKLEVQRNTESAQNLAETSARIDNRDAAQDAELRAQDQQNQQTDTIASPFAKIAPVETSTSEKLEETSRKLGFFEKRRMNRANKALRVIDELSPTKESVGIDPNADTHNQLKARGDQYRDIRDRMYSDKIIPNAQSIKAAEKFAQELKDKDLKARAERGERLLDKDKKRYEKIKK